MLKMSVYEIDPLRDPRWAELVDIHPMACVFHMPGWLEALHRTYGYKSFALTTTQPGQPLKNGLVFCRVKSWLTGTRIVSLPFSDHCQPLVDDAEDLRLMLSHLKEGLRRERLKYVELRPLLPPCMDLGSLTPFAKTAEFCCHKLDLRPDLDTLFRNFHRASTRKTIRHAQQQNLEYERGRSRAMIEKFYHLLLLTRRRHQLPPQPIEWFQNLVGCLGDMVTIRILCKDGRPVVAALMFFYKKCLMDKYGCSDARFHGLGGMPLLIWNAIQEAKELGAEELDLGRSDLDNPSLITFKDHWGATRSPLTYYRHSSRQYSRESSHGWRMAIARKAFSALPDFCLRAAGSILYKHVG